MDLRKLVILVPWGVDTVWLWVFTTEHDRVIKLNLKDPSHNPAIPAFSSNELSTTATAHFFNCDAYHAVVLKEGSTLQIIL